MHRTYSAAAVHLRRHLAIGAGECSAGCARTPAYFLRKDNVGTPEMPLVGGVLRCAEISATSSAAGKTLAESSATSPISAAACTQAHRCRSGSRRPCKKLHQTLFISGLFLAQSPTLNQAWLVGWRLGWRSSQGRAVVRALLRSAAANDASGTELPYLGLGPRHETWR